MAVTVTDIGRPFSGKIWYWLETTYGVGPSGATELAANLPVSCKVLDVRVGTGDRHVPLVGIDSPMVCHLLKQTNEPTLHLEYIPQTSDTMIDDVVDRIGNCCTLQSLAFCIAANSCLTGINSSWYNVLGAKPNTVTIAGAKNEPYKITVDYLCKSILTAKVATGSEPTCSTVSTYPYLQFNVAGEIRKTGGLLVNTDHIAFITNTINLTFNHNLKGYTDHDALLKSYLVEGKYDIEGTCDITLDGGGALHFGEVLANTAFTVEVRMGALGSGAPMITLPGCEWKNSEVNLNISGEAMLESAPFTAKPSDCSAIVGSVPTS
jgi:hypothetical protein